MIILGIDPGLNTTGYGLIRLERSQVHFLAAGEINTGKAHDFSAKLEILYTTCCEIIEDHKPDVFAIEETFSNVNPRTSLKLAGKIKGVTGYEYPATIVKKALTGVGSASKEQVKYMVMKMLKMPSLEGKMDISDALAVAITHYNQLKYGLLTNKK